MKQFLNILLLGLCLTPITHAASVEKYSDWKGRPHEAFNDAENSFRTTMDKLLAEYLDKGLTKDDLYRAATAGMLESLNSGEQSWNTLLSPKELSDLKADLSGQMTGIGIEMKFDETMGNGLVIGIIPQSPSSKAGLKRDDVILSVDGKRFKGKQFRDIVNAIRGKTGESVALKVLRDDKVTSFNIKREIVPWTPVELSRIDGSTQLLTIGYFTSETPKLVEAKIQAINKDNTKNLIIDMRCNTGGGFDQAVQTAELFVPKNELIASTKDRDGVSQSFMSSKGLLNRDIKVTVLTNKSTSSGAELFTAALQDQLGAKIVGEGTLGKWNAQMIDVLPNGFAIKFTVKSFQSPKGKSYQDVGVKPDVEVALPKGVESRELRIKYDVAKRLELDSQLKAATELTK